MPLGSTLVALLAFALSGCGSRHAQWTDTLTPGPADPGWHYSWNSGQPRAIYGFPEQSRMAFSAFCDREPSFALVGGTYSDDTRVATLIIGHRKRRFVIYRGAHGSGLLFLPDLEYGAKHALPYKQEALSIARDLAAARTPILIGLDDGWIRQVPPSASVGRFVRECLSLRKTEQAAGA